MRQHVDLTRITWEERDGVGIATLNQSERLNVIDTRTMAELEQVVEVAWNKEHIHANWSISIEDALLNRRRAGEHCGKTDDHYEGLRASIEKRDPAFRGA